MLYRLDGIVAECNSAPVVPARRVAEVIECGASAHAQVGYLSAAGVVLAVKMDKTHPQIGWLVHRGWCYSHVNHCAFVRLSVRQLRRSA